MEPILAALEVESFGKPVRVEFMKTGDLISHTIFLVNGDEKVPVLTSRGNAPGLPCFTELHQQDDLLFLTGSDGPCHWSMSVESRQDLGKPGLVFDIACRVKEPPLVLGTEYSTHVQGGWTVEPLDDCANVESNDSCVRIACVSAIPTAVPATVRWKYRIRHQ